MSQFRYTSVFLKDGWIYVFTFANANDQARTYDRCLAKHPENVVAAALGRDVLSALRTEERFMGLEEFRSRQNPILSATGYKTHTKLNKGLASVEVSQASPEKEISVLPRRNKGRDIFPMTEERTSLPKEIDAEELGKCVLRLLARSREVNSPHQH